MNSSLSEKLSLLLEANQEADLVRLLEGLHPADVADLLEPLEGEVQARLLSLLDPDLGAEVFLELSEPSRDQVLAAMPLPHLSALIDEMDSDDAADIVADLTAEDQAVVLESIDHEDSAEVKRLLLYEEETAGGIMQLELVSAREDETTAEAIEHIRAKREEVDDLTFVFVVDESGRLRGRVDLPQLVLADPDQVLRELMIPCELVVGVDEDQEEVAQKFHKYDVRSAPVVDSRGLLLGRITVDDVLDVVQQETSEDFYRLAGTTKEEEVYSGRIFKISRLRLPWLLANLLGGLLSGYLVWLFKVTLQDVLALITFIPAIMALGGSVGVQSSTIVVRGMALGRVGPGQMARILFKEFRVALIMGLVCGLGGAVVARVWHGHLVLGLVVGLSMVSAILLASLLGALTPALFRRLSIDPALASGPFVTTANDILGILLYMGLATIFLKFLV